MKNSSGNSYTFHFTTEKFLDKNTREDSLLAASKLQY